MNAIIKQRAAWVIFGLTLVGCVATQSTQPVPPPPDPPASSNQANTEKPPEWNANPDDSFRKNAPKPGPDVTFVPPNIQEQKLTNGIRVLYVERKDLPAVAIQIISDRGAEASTQGVASFAATLLLSGTKTKSALQISDAFEALGAQYYSGADWDSVYLGAKVLNNHFSDAAGLLADILINPTFPKDEIERERSKRLTSLAQEIDSPGRLMGRALAEVLYPAKHAYSATLLGDEASLNAINSASLSAFHQQQIKPNHLTIAVSGNVSKDEVVKTLEKHFGSWRGVAPAATSPQTPAFDPKSPKIVIVDKPKAAQSNLVVASVGVGRSTPDFEALLILNTVLGGKFSSRLNLRLREELGITYGVGSRFDMRHGPGPFSAGGAIVTKSTAQGVKEIFAAIEKIRAEGISDEELADAKSYLIKQLPSRFESVGEMASTMTSLSLYGLPLDEFNHRAEKIQKLTKAQILDAAKKHLMPDQMKVVIVGDASVIKSDLEALKLGSIDVRQPPKAPAPSKNTATTTAPATKAK